MSDLIKQLRYAAQGELFGDTLLEEAADRIEQLEAALREIVLYAKPKYRSTRDKLVRDGVCLSGGLLHYESMPHVIHAGKQVLLRERDDGS